MFKKLLVALGFVSLILGIIGTVLPVMPTIPFLFLSYICFNKGSDKFRQWYIHSKFHKQYLKGMTFYKSIPLIYKILYIIGIICFISAVITLSILFYEEILYFLKALF